MLNDEYEWWLTNDTWCKYVARLSKITAYTRPSGFYAHEKGLGSIENACRIFDIARSPTGPRLSHQPKAVSKFSCLAYWHHIKWRQKKLYSFLYLWGTRMSTKYYDTTQQAIILFLSHTKIRPKILEWWIYFNRCRSYVLPDSKMRRHSTVGHKNYWTYAKVLDTCFCVYFWVPAVSVQLACHSECSIMRLDVR